MTRRDKQLIILSILVCIVLGLIFLTNPNPETLIEKSRASQDEARILLTSLYNVEMDARTEYGTFATCIQDLGFEHISKGHFIFGFTDINPAANAIVKSKNHKCGSNSYVLPKTLIIKVTPEDLPKTSLSEMKFTAAAVGRLTTDPEYPLDIWTINQNKQLIHVQDGSQKIALWKKIYRDLAR